LGIERFRSYPTVSYGLPTRWLRSLGLVTLRFLALLCLRRRAASWWMPSSGTGWWP